MKRWIVQGCAVVIAGLSPAMSSFAQAQQDQPSGIPKPLTQSCAPSKADCATKPCASKGDCCGCDSSSLFGCCCEPLFGIGDINSYLGDDSSISVGGWTQFGYHNKNNGLFNNHRDNINLHQQWFYMEKVADGKCGLDWGFRVDAMYGVDAADTQAFGNRPGKWDYQNGFDHGIYGFAMPQLYGELAMGDLSVKIGHFFTIIGYEVVTAPDNFFYSHAYTMYNSEPFTHTGALATYTAGDVTLYGGWTLGWDTGFDQNDKGSSFLGGVSVPAGENVTFTYITTIGDFGARGEGYSHSLVTDIAISDKLNYVIQSDLVETNAGSDHQFGINQYLFYALNDCVKLGYRGEWWKNAGNSQYASTFGVNVKTASNFIVRPEVRYDWNPGTDTNFTTLGIDFILSY